MLKYIFFIYKLTTFFTETISYTCPYSITCNNSLPSTFCLTKNKTDSNKVFDLNVKTCLSSDYTYCNAYDAFISNTEKSVICENIPTYLAGYPGDICKSNNDCLYGFCINQQCINNFEDTCDGHENCLIGQACISNKCSPYKKIGETCSNSYECVLNAVCYEDKCIKMYSFKNGEEIDKNYLDKGNELCESGDFYLDEGKYICGSLRNIHDSCREDCEYYNENNKIIALEERCVCGYNKERSKHCILGSGEQQYIDFINERKNLINNDNYTNYCHTLERDSYDICIKAKRVNRTVAFRTFMQNYTNNKILALDHAKVNSSESCVKYALFGYSNELIVPDIQQCPKVTCDHNLSTCLYGENPFNEEGNNIFVKVNDKICSNNEICHVNGIKYSMAKIFTQHIIEGQCMTLNKTTTSRYPGEDCLSDQECFSSNCERNKCKGKGLDNECTNTSECIVGLYCNNHTKTCQKQVGLGGECHSSWDCLNYLGCYKGKCIKFGSLANGVSLTEEDSRFENNKSKRAFLCEYGMLSYKGDQCAMIDYMGETLQKLHKGEEFVKCNKEDYCYYWDGESEHKHKCQCGYNKEGQGYCTLPNKYKQNNWKERVKIYGDLCNNKCHSLSRFDCYLISDEERERKKRRASILTFEANLFYGADDCLHKVFAKGNIIKTYSLLVYGVVIIFLFL